MAIEKEALEMLKNTIHCVKMGAGQAVCEDCNLYECDHSVVEGLCRIALNALEKQWPKKVKYIETTTDGHLLGYCPSCSLKFLDENKFCYECGQALDWSD